MAHILFCMAFLYYDAGCIRINELLFMMTIWLIYCIKESQLVSLKMFLKCVNK